MKNSLWTQKEQISRNLKSSLKYVFFAPSPSFISCCHISRWSIKWKQTWLWKKIHKQLIILHRWQEIKLRKLQSLALLLVKTQSETIINYMGSLEKSYWILFWNLKRVPLYSGSVHIWPQPLKQHFLFVEQSSSLWHASTHMPACPGLTAGQKPGLDGASAHLQISQPSGPLAQPNSQYILHITGWHTDKEINSRKINSVKFIRDYVNNTHVHTI